MRVGGFLGHHARVSGVPHRSCFQSFTPAERGADEGWRWAFPAGKTLRQHRSEGTTVLVTL
ncbi:hypothetical protein BN844_0755 [Pseudomonas sp. SHC52]|nr:hypothetical protein BN844_0755 [Pseudomonas sp. SHC52]